MAKMVSFLSVLALMGLPFDGQTPGIFYLAILPVLLPLHEVCHASYCWLTGKKVDRICFFPISNKPKMLACVRPEFTLWNRMEKIWFNFFPLLILTVFPAVLSIVIPEYSFWLRYISLLNLAISYLDLESIFWMAALPPNMIFAGNMALIPNGEDMVVIHRLFIHMESRVVEHTQFCWEHGTWSEQIPAEETAEVKQCRKEMEEYYFKIEEALE